MTCSRAWGVQAPRSWPVAMLGLLVLTGCPEPKRLHVDCVLSLDVVGRPLSEATSTLERAGLRIGAMGYGCWEPGSWWCSRMCVVRLVADAQGAVTAIVDEPVVECGPSDMWVSEGFGNCEPGVFGHIRPPFKEKSVGPNAHSAHSRTGTGSAAQ